MKVQRIYIGSWFQRTTLHLSEIYDFFVGEDSPLDFDKTRLHQLHDALNLKEVQDIVGDLEQVCAETTDGITIKVYEDGLITLMRDPGEAGIKDDIQAITRYYEEQLSPALKYLFSLGAPIPKELANIKNVFPYFVVLEKAKEKDIEELLEEFDQEKHFEIKEKTFEVYRGDVLYIINSLGEPLENIEQFVGEQVFMREFKAQLHRYLNLHRIIWENIAEVKERGEIKGRNIGAFRSKIERYQKTISMIDTRIDQMGTYIKTRGSVLKDNPEMEKFIPVLKFKHETLSDTLSYIKDIWGMTKRYVDSALGLFSDLHAQATNSSIQNLTVVTSMGVGATLIGLFTDGFPTFTIAGIYYFIILAAIGWITSRVMKTISLRRTYSIEDVEADTNIT